MAAIWNTPPIDVEARCVRRALAPLEHVEPPRIVGVADAHVIGHKIEDKAEAILLERGTQPRERFFAAKFGIEPVMIDDVVAVRTSRTRLEEGRRIKVRDA